MSERYSCEVCDKTFKSKVTLKCHVKRMHMETATSHSCDECPRTFLSKQKLEQHLDGVHRPPKFACDLCSYKTRKLYNLHELLSGLVTSLFQLQTPAFRFY